MVFWSIFQIYSLSASSSHKIVTFIPSLKMKHGQWTIVLSSELFRKDCKNKYLGSIRCFHVGWIFYTFYDPLSVIKCSVLIGTLTN